MQSEWQRGLHRFNLSVRVDSDPWASFAWRAGENSHGERLMVEAAAQQTGHFNHGAAGFRGSICLANLVSQRFNRFEGVEQTFEIEVESNPFTAAIFGAAEYSASPRLK